VAIFYPPPQPFVGAWQPLEPRKLVPPSVPVNNSPPYRLDSLLAQINLAWQPPPPLPTLNAKRTPPSVDKPPGYRLDSLLAQLNSQWQTPPFAPPMLGAKLTPPSVIVSQPPRYRLDSLLAQVNLAWQPGPPLPQNLPFIVQPGVIAAYQPYSNQWLPIAIQAWQPGPLQPPAGQRLTPPSVAVNNPPLLAAPNLQVSQAWQLAGPILLQNTGLISTVAAVAAPVGVNPAWLYAELNAIWQQVPFQPQIGQQLTPPSVPVNNPPLYSTVELAEQYTQAWQPFVPLPQVLPFQTPPVSIAVNNPPSYDPQWFLEQMALSWLPAQPQPQTLPFAPIPAVVVTSIPYTAAWLPGVLQAWQPAPFLPQSLPTQIVSVPVNNPPGYTTVEFAEQYTQAWQPFIPLPQVLASVTPPVSTDNPPSYRQDMLLGQINASWQQTWTVPPLAELVQGTIAIVNNPPSYTLASLLAQINIEWQPGPPLPTLNEQLTPPTGPTPPPPVTAPISGGVYPGDEWTGRREKKKDAALQTPQGEEVTATVFAQRYLAAKRKFEQQSDDELYIGLLHFMIQMDEDNEE